MNALRKPAHWLMLGLLMLQACATSSPPLPPPRPVVVVPAPPAEAMKSSTANAQDYSGKAQAWSLKARDWLKTVKPD